MSDAALREYAGERAVAMLSDVLYTSQRETIRALLIAGIGLGIPFYITLLRTIMQ